MEDEYTMREEISAIFDSLPTYRKHLDTAKKGFEEAQKEGVFSVKTEADLKEFISYTELILEKLGKATSLVLEGDYPKENLDKIAEELNGYHEYILDADIYLLIFIRDEIADYASTNQTYQTLTKEAKILHG